MRNSCCQPGRKNMKTCCTEEECRAAQSGEFWQILHCASDKRHRRKDADTEILLVVKAHVMLLGCTQMLCIPGVPRHLASSTQNRGVFLKAEDLHGGLEEVKMTGRLQPVVGRYYDARGFLCWFSSRLQLLLFSLFLR
ncbi:uncharacterized protein M6G45_013978 isoform 1-T1 [Spheniscus humboldti]